VITELQGLVGKTIEKVHDHPFEGFFLYFKGGEFALITASGEERHGQHWPILSEDAADIGLMTGASDDG